MRARLLLLALVLVAFGGSLGSGFHFDDYAIFADHSLTSPAGWREVWRMDQTRPLTYLTFWLNYRLGGRNPAGYHALNLLLHALAVLLLHAALRNWMSERAALAAAAIFAVHPAVSEAVLYVWARSVLLAAVFCLASLRAWRQGNSFRAVAWFAAALLSKEECAAFPLLLLAADRQRWKPAVAMLMLSVAAAARVVYAAAVIPGAPIAQHAGVTPLQYLLAQGFSLLRYLRLVLIPWGFTIDPDVRLPRLGWGLLAWAPVAVLLALAWRRRAREGRWILAALILLIPSSSLFPAADLAADRRLYLPMLAFGALFGTLVARGGRWVTAALCAVLALLSIGRTQVWLSDARLWREALERSPGKLRPHLQLARLVPLGQALPLLAEAERIAPENATVASTTGAVLLAAGRPAEALPAFGRALALAPDDARNYNNRGTALAALGQTDAARLDFLHALDLAPDLEEAQTNLLALPSDSGPRPMGAVTLP